MQEQWDGVWPSYDPTSRLAAAPCCLPQRAVPRSLRVDRQPHCKGLI